MKHCVELYIFLCRELLDPGTFGDRLSVYLLSIGLGVRIGVVRPDQEAGKVQLANIRTVSHLFDFDLLLIHNGAQHYSAAGRCTAVLSVLHQW